MMQLLNLLSDRRRKVAASVNARLAELARKEATGRVTAKDAEELADLLAQAGIDDTEYATRVNVHAQQLADKKTAARLPELKAAARATRAEIEADDLAGKEAERQREERQRERRRTLAKQEREAAGAKRAAQAVQRREVEFAEILGAEPRDFDRITPCFAGSTVSHYDRAAEKVECPHAIYMREEARRARIMSRARERAIDEYKAAQEKWRASLPHDRSGMPIATQADLANEPKFKAPTWAEIVAAGLHKTLDVPDRINGRAA